MSNLDQIIQQCSHLSINDTARIYNSAEALPVIQVKNALCEASICLYGAHILSFKPNNNEELLWVSPNADFAQGKAIRGGIPVCFPWFAVNQDEPHKPKHGFVRQRTWQLDAAKEAANGGTLLTFSYQSQAEDKTLFNGDFIVKLHVECADELTIQLEVENTGSTTYPIRWALHSYFAIDDVAHVEVAGLTDCEYRDNTQDLKIITQTANVNFDGEVDRAFFEAPEQQSILSNGKAVIGVKGVNAPSAIVWNPGQANAANIADIGSEPSRRYVCVERGCAFSDVWQLEPGKREIGTKIISAL